MEYLLSTSSHPGIFFPEEQDYASNGQSSYCLIKGLHSTPEILHPVLFLHTLRCPKTIGQWKKAPFQLVVPLTSSLWILSLKSGRRTCSTFSPCSIVWTPVSMIDASHANGSFDCHTISAYTEG